jgi:hypothetical protein
MTSPQGYRNKITNLGLNDWGMTVSSISEAKKALHQVQSLKDSLWELKRGIKIDISSVWDEYRKESKDSVGDSIVAAFLGKRRSYKIRKHTRTQLAKNRDQLVASYRAVDSMIDDLLKQLDSSKSRLWAFVNELNAEKKEKKRKQTRKNYRRSNTQMDYNKYIKSQEWRTKAEEAKARAGNRCQVCNRSRAEVQLDAHHRTYKRLGKELPEDITVLCRECHQLYEDKKKLAPINVAELSENGFCIRCKKTIKLNPQVPYCYSCFKVWKKFENADYQENHCHICGNENQSTLLKPACYDCYKEHRDKV